MNQKLESKGISWLRIFILLLNYTAGYMFFYPMLLVWSSKIFHFSYIQYQIATFLIYVFMIFVSLIVAWPLLKESYTKQREFRKFIESILLMFVAVYVINILTSGIISLLTGLESSENQTGIITAFYANPLLISFSTLIYAPIVEEITFRGAVFRPLRKYTNFWISALISGILFGFIHVMDSLFIGNFIDLSFMLTYASLGFLFCFCYEKNKSIFAPMLLHFLNNGLGVIGILLSIFLGM